MCLAKFLRHDKLVVFYRISLIPGYLVDFSINLRKHQGLDHLMTFQTQDPQIYSKRSLPKPCIYMNIISDIFVL